MSPIPTAALLMTVAVVLITALIMLGTRKHALVPGRWQSLAEMSYEFVADMVETNVGHGGREFFPFVFTLFMFILFANFLGLIPVQLHDHQPDRRHLCACRSGVRRRDDRRHSSGTASIFCDCFVPQGVPAPLLAAARADRAVVLLHPAVHLCRSGCLPTCWPGTRCWRFLLASLRPSASSAYSRWASRPAHRPRSARCRAASLCVRDPHLSLSERRHPPALNHCRTSPNLGTHGKSNGSSFRQNDRRRPRLHCPGRRRYRHRQCVLRR